MESEKEIIRASVTTAIQRWTPQANQNLTKQQFQALKTLSKDKSITILPADKGRAVVVMNSTDYSTKIHELLQDTKTYQKITDKRRNPTSSTEKAKLNKLLLHIKKQPSPYNPNVTQLSPKFYFKLHSTDATPSTFYGLPKVHKKTSR